MCYQIEIKSVRVKTKFDEIKIKDAKMIRELDKIGSEITSVHRKPYLIKIIIDICPILHYSQNRTCLLCDSPPLRYFLIFTYD